MNELKIFENEEFGSLRTMEIDGKIYFVAKDVAGILGYSNPRKAISDHVDEEDKGVTKCDTLGGNQNLTTINESGLYSLVLYSKMPNAKKFKHWITADVLPSIRQYGAYLTPDTLEKAILNPDDVDLLIEKYKDVGWEIENISYFLSSHNLFAEWSNIELFFKIPEEVKNNGK